MSIVGSVIRELREERGWKLVDLAGQSNIDVSLLSRLENGKISRPSREAMHRLLGALEVHVLDFADRCERQRALQTGDESVLTIAWDHCVWGAPIVVPIYESTLREDALAGIRLSSYGLYDRDGNLEPYYYGPSKKRDAVTVPRGPSFTHSYDPDRSHTTIQTESWDDAAIKTFTANDIAELYRTGKIDAMIVPSIMADEFKQYYNDLLRCASIMHTGEACSLLTLWNEASANGRPASTGHDRDFQQLRTYIRDKPDPLLTVLFARGTVAEVQIEDYLDYLDRAIRAENPRARVRHQDVDLGNWNRGPSSFLEVITQEFMKNDIVSFLGWEPHISWATKAIEDHVRTEARQVPSATRVRHHQSELWELLARLDPSFRSRSPYFLGFQLLIRDTALTGPDGVLHDRLKALDNLFSSLSDAARRIKRAQRDHSPIVHYVASYLDMPPDQCKMALDRLNFALWFHPEWYEFIKTQYHHPRGVAERAP